MRGQPIENDLSGQRVQLGFLHGVVVLALQCLHFVNLIWIYSRLLPEPSTHINTQAMLERMDVTQGTVGGLAVTAGSGSGLETFF